MFYLAPLDDTTGVVHWLYPVPPAFLFGFRPEEHEDAYTLNLDYHNWRVVRENVDPPLPSGCRLAAAEAARLLDEPRQGANLNT